MTSRDAVFRAALRAAKLPMPVPEYPFWPGRRFRFDYAWPAELVALEVEGGVWTRGRHVRGAGFLRDSLKYNEAAARWWSVLRVTPQQLPTQYTMNLLRRVLC